MNEKKYVSTRGQQRPLDFCDAILQGIGSDGGLLVPDFELDQKVDNERLVSRAIDVYFDRSTNNVENFYAEVLEIVPIPKVEELNKGIWGTEIRACLIDKEEFDKTWINLIYDGTMMWFGGFYG